MGSNSDINANNLFSYCSNNPINCNDPTGKSWLTVTGICAAVVVVCAVAVVAAPALAAASGVVTASSIASGAFAIGTGATEIGLASLAMNAADSINLSKRSKTYNPDPNARPGQKKQNREVKAKARQKDDFEPRSNKRRPQAPKSHRPMKDHQKYKPNAIVPSDSSEYGFYNGRGFHPYGAGGYYPEFC